MALRADERRDKLRQSITYGREPGELKHLSTRRKRKKIDFLSSGERTGKSPNRGIYPAGLWTAKVTWKLGEWFWESQPERVKAPYPKMEGSGRIQSMARHEKPCQKQGGPPPKAKYYLVTDRA